MTGITTNVILVLSAVLTLGFMLYATSPLEQGVTQGVALLAFVLWALSPYAALASLARRVKGSAYRSWLVLGVSIVAGALAVVLQYSVFVAHPDPQGGLVYLFLPLYQWCAVGPIFLLLRWLGRSTRVALASGAKFGDR